MERNRMDMKLQHRLHHCHQCPCMITHRNSTRSSRTHGHSTCPAIRQEAAMWPNKFPLPCTQALTAHLTPKNRRASLRLWSSIQKVLPMISAMTTTCAPREANGQGKVVSR